MFLYRLFENNYKNLMFVYNFCIRNAYIYLQIFKFYLKI
jgi:hypothetical protein